MSDADTTVCDLCDRERHSDDMSQCRCGRIVCPECWEASKTDDWEQGGCSQCGPVKAEAGEGGQT